MDEIEENREGGRQAGRQGKVKGWRGKGERREGGKLS